MCCKPARTCPPARGRRRPTAFRPPGCNHRHTQPILPVGLAAVILTSWWAGCPPKRAGRAFHPDDSGSDDKLTRDMALLTELAKSSPGENDRTEFSGGLCCAAVTGTWEARFVLELGRGGYISFGSERQPLHSMPRIPTI